MLISFFFFIARGKRNVSHRLGFVTATKPRYIALLSRQKQASSAAQQLALWLPNDFGVVQLVSVVADPPTAELAMLLGLPASTVGLDSHD